MSERAVSRAAERAAERYLVALGRRWQMGLAVQIAPTPEAVAEYRAALAEEAAARRAYLGDTGIRHSVLNHASQETV